MDLSKTLLRKEFDEHRWLLCSLLFSTLFFIWVCNFYIEKFKLLSLLSIAWGYVYYMMPLLGVVFGHQIVAREHLGRTQRFLESLPISGRRVFAVKYLFGLFSLLALVLLMLVVVCWLAFSTENLNIRSISILVMRCFAMVVLVWGLVISFSFCGALRLPLIAVVLLLALVVHRFTDFDLFGAGPFELFEHARFAYDGYLIPWRAFFICLAIGFLGALVGGWIANFRQGGVAQSLARPMGPREYFVVAVCTLIAVVIFVRSSGPAFNDDYAVEGVNILENGDQNIRVRYKDAASVELARFVVEDLEQLTSDIRSRHDYSGELPKIRMFVGDNKTDESIDYSAIGSVNTVNEKYKDDYHRAFIHSTLMHYLFAQTSNGRALFEGNHWFLDGYSIWLALYRQQPDSKGFLRLHNELLARAILAKRQITDDMSVLRQWEEITESVGTYSTLALSYSLVHYFVEKYGHEPALSLADDLLLKPIPKNWNVSWVDRFQSFESRFFDLSGIAWSDFMAVWTQGLDRSAKDSAVQAFLKPLTDLEVWFEERTDSIIAFGFKNATGEFVVPPSFEQCYLRHDESKSWLIHQSESSLVSVQFPCDSMTPSEHSMKHRYDRGVRVFIALDVDVEGFFGSIRLVTRRIVIQ